MHQIVSWSRLIARWPHWQPAAEAFCAQFELQAGTALCAFLDDDDPIDVVTLHLTDVGARQVSDTLLRTHRMRIHGITATKRASVRDPNKAFYVQYRLRPAAGAEIARSYYAPLALHQIATLQAWETAITEACALVHCPFQLPTVPCADTTRPAQTTPAAVSSAVSSAISVAAPTATIANVAKAPTATNAIPMTATLPIAADQRLGPRQHPAPRPSAGHPAPTELGQLMLYARLWMPGEQRNLVRQINLRRALIMQTIMQSQGLPAYGDGRIARMLVIRTLSRVLETAGPFTGDPRDDVAVIAWLRDQLTLVPAVAA